MNSPKICFITTNTIWGGSEVLWTASLQHFIELDVTVYAAAAYDYDKIKFTGIEEHFFLKLSKRWHPPTLNKRLLSKMGMAIAAPTDRLMVWLQECAPDVVVISQGNNVEGFEYMQLCKSLNIAYITLTHLAFESLWPSLDDHKINALIDVYENARKNYFVSGFVKRMHDTMLAKSCLNYEIISNPFIKEFSGSHQFPTFENDLYKVALVGRIEVYHKGLDILLEVFKQKKWQERNIQVSVFGSGPHKDWFQRTVEKYKINNIFLQQHVEAIEIIWQQHQLLLMPSRMEGQSLTLLESMKFERACVVTPVGGVDELVIDGKTGFVSKNITPEAFDAAMETAWQHRHQWEEMGKAAALQFALKIPEYPVQDFSNKIYKLALMHS